ncbi:MAG: non-canonical purine NTP pyrophosphatase, partial [Nitrososphaeria archaeon]|nr:non-canonical purine NTP pyrophosphatase [Nitrososphaeria archaeon]
GWGYDPIFIPQGKTKTYAQIPDKDTLSHRYKALEKFASWFVRTQR